ncbi:proton-translocating NADH-quinone oxidoreductase, chain L [Gaiella occulta]|uniref:Proton-translocating NADH-quinone oxidoreductase, chain L n=1 Tax=Gaiella occulta TaxID=1002870 RepID=A0A7M2YVK6_9ACTN|nr:NADH-quinone oxidoreductase subunit L [Gaiella occulta]RDI74172.1 proton-translocating NADH-quinone oxidoreductase, chain L [Gaiella occulta]
MIWGAWLCLFAPLGGAIAITVAGERISRTAAGWISTLSVFAGFAGALVSFVSTLGRDAADREQLSTAWSWLAAGDFRVGLQILVDPLALTMMLVVTGVGGLIVWYSIGYMHGEDEERRYFATMALFVFSMLMLVQGGNLLLLLVGWGLVGLASYLLIGFYHERPEAVAAAKKAFVMNAVGDAAMALGFFLLIAKVGSLDFGRVFEAAQGGGLSSTTLNLVALGLLAGAVAKSAQIPLHTWLPDAMEGPTPVSALIHAATMVTAGVYLIVRTHPVFEAAPGVQHLAAIIGAVTLLVAGFVALVQWDMKRVIAYSTMSQIGYMFLAAGVGAYGFAMFHLVTHAFFKALMFLAAGIVIHRLDGEQDIRKMGGLRRTMPFTWITFLVGTLALVGIPPLAGFWSKDAILSAALATGGALGWFLFAAGILGAFLTGMYALRLYLMVFEGEPAARDAHAGGHAAHGRGEGPRSMLIPVGALAALSAVGGLINVPGAWRTFEHWIGEVAVQLVEPSVAQDYGTSAVAVLVGVAGALVARRAFTQGRELVTMPGARTVLEHKLYFDELYDAVFARPAQIVADRLREDVETPVVQGSLTEIGAGTRAAAAGVARLQTGLLRTYALTIAASVVVLVVVFLAVR